MGGNVLGMPNLTPDLAATYLNILVVLMLTVVVEHRFEEHAPSRHLLSLVSASQWIIGLDIAVAIALTIGLDTELWWVFGFAAKIAIVLTAGHVAGRFIGSMSALREEAKRRELESTSS